MLVIRAGSSVDLPFIMDSWQKGYRYGSSFGRSGMMNSVFYIGHRRVIESLLPESLILVAALEEDPSIIVGYAVIGAHDASPILHWCHVKEPFRRRGIASLLFGAANFPPKLKGVVLSHASDDWYKFLRSKFPDAVYDPYRQFWPAESSRAPSPGAGTLPLVAG